MTPILVPYDPNAVEALPEGARIAYAVVVLVLALIVLGIPALLAVVAVGRAASKKVLTPKVKEFLSNSCRIEGL